jgi:molybdopterin-guanine dinucleotide biosynthesis protein A
VGGTAWLVIAGGLGSRYGEPKYAADYRGATFLDRCLALIGSVAQAEDTTWVVLRDGQPWIPPVGVRLVRDDSRLSGPTAGLYAGIASLDGEQQPPEFLVTMPVDMPYLTSDVLVDLRDRSAPRATIAVAQSRGSGDMHWPLASYAGVRLPAVADRITAGDRSLHKIIDAIGFVTVGVDDEVARNINHRPS